MWRKFEIASYILSTEVGVLIVDTNIVFFRSPIQLFSNDKLKDLDYWAMPDAHANGDHPQEHTRVNTGFSNYAPTLQARDLMDLFLHGNVCTGWEQGDVHEILRNSAIPVPQ